MSNKELPENLENVMVTFKAVRKFGVYGHKSEVITFFPAKLLNENQ